MPLRTFTQAELILTERHRFERPLLGMVWLGVAALSLIEGIWFYMVAGTLAVAVNLVAVRRGREVYLHRGFVNAAVLLASTILMIEILAAGLNPLTALGHYLILIQLCKLFERKRNRDYVQVIALSGLVMVSASLQSDTLWFAAILVVYLGLACYTAMVFTLKRGLDAAAEARLATESGPMAPHRVAWNVIRDWPGRALRRNVISALLAMLGMGLLLFLAAPRGRGAQPGPFGQTSANGSSGFAGALKLGDVKKVYLSDRIVMNVRAGDPPLSGYLTGRVFTSYGESRWTTSERPSPGRKLPLPPEDVTADAVVQDISMVPDLLPTLFSDQPVLYVESPQGQVSASSEGLSLVVRNWPDRPVRYRAYIARRPPTDSQRRHIARTSGSVARWGLGHVEVRPRVAALARKWCEDLLAERRKNLSRRDQLDLRIARRLAGNLRKRCTYTLDLSDADSDRDGVEDFLFYTKRGHCEYFASALTVMCRELGVRARLAAGFYVDATSRVDDSYVVRERDAHAWTQVFTGRAGWLPIDATPSQQHAPAQNRLGFVRDIWESAKFFWYEKVAGYDASTRKAVGRWLKESAVAMGATLKTILINLLVGGFLDEALYRLSLITCFSGLALALVLIWRRARHDPARRRRQALAGAGISGRQFVFARKLFELLRRHSRPRGPHQTEREWALAAASELHLPADAVSELVALYYRLRWGHVPTGVEELHAAERRVRQLATALGR